MRFVSYRQACGLRVLAAASGLSLALHGCGGGGAGAADPGPPVVPPSPPRVQDSRSFTTPVETTLAELPGSSVPTDRWVGTLDGAAYRIEVPKQWNGILVMWARGYWSAQDLFIEAPLIRRHLIANGYAWAASSFTRNFYDVNAGIEDTNKLALRFQQLAASHGRALAAPRRLFIAGMSMGGHIAAAAVESDVIRDARNPVRYDGALSMCGSLSGVGWYEYMAAYQLAMQQLLGFPAETYPSVVYAQNLTAMRNLLPSAQGPGAPEQSGVVKLRALMEQLSGGARPFYREGWEDAYHHNILFALMNGRPTLDGILALNAMDTSQVQYRFSGATAVDEETRQFNAQVRRLVADADPNPRQPQGLRWVPLTAGQLTAPVMTLQTLGDLTVPITEQIRYRARVQAQGAADRLTQRLVRDVGHCSFTDVEVRTAFDDLVVWAEQGRKPGGDDLSDSRAWTASGAGCAFTDNRASADDRADATKRAKVQSAYPACPPR